MKKFINTLLKPFHAEIHGTGFLKKLQKNAFSSDAFTVQGRMLKNHATTIFDIGANKGLVTRRYAKAFPGASIHAFEPFEEFHAQFRQDNPDTGSIHLNSIALSDKDGEADFYLNESSDTNSLLEPSSIGANSDKACLNKGVRKVNTLRLENYCLQKDIRHIDILKMDTQGSELSILKGGESLLRENAISLIYTEGYFKPQYKDQPLLYDIANYLASFGYYLEDIYDPYYNEKYILWCDAIFLPLHDKR
jgi:FkbM family methyltransferase